MLWTIALLLTGVSGILLAGSKRRSVRLAGWTLYTANEVLWFFYGLTLHATPLILMSLVWFTAGVVNIIRTERNDRLSRKVGVSDAEKVFNVANTKR